MKQKLLFILAIVFTTDFLCAQHIQFRFCGATTAVSPTNDPSTGADQRKRGAIRLDYISLGLPGQSECCPFHAIGYSSSTKPWTFANATFADGCSANNRNGDCTPCTTCKDPYYGNNIVVGKLWGQIYDNAKVEGLNSDLWIESTGQFNQVCFETSKIDVSPYRGKKLEVRTVFQGYADSQFSIKNVNFTYRYNADPYPATPYFWNKNSNIIGIYAETNSVPVVPTTAVEDLSDQLEFDVQPNPVIDLLILELNILESFSGSIKIWDIQGKQVYSEDMQFSEGSLSKSIPVQDLNAGLYQVTISDQEGRISYRKFFK